MSALGVVAGLVEQAGLVGLGAQWQRPGRWPRRLAGAGTWSPVRAGERARRCPRWQGPWRRRHGRWCRWPRRWSGSCGVPSPDWPPPVAGSPSGSWGPDAGATVARWSGSGPWWCPGRRAAHDDDPLVGQGGARVEAARGEVVQRVMAPEGLARTSPVMLTWDSPVKPGRLPGHGDRGDVGQLDGAAAPAGRRRSWGCRCPAESMAPELGAPGPGGRHRRSRGGAQVGAHEVFIQASCASDWEVAPAPRDLLPTRSLEALGSAAPASRAAGGQRGQGGHAQGAQGAW